MLNSREGDISYGIFHVGLSQLGGNAACWFPKMIQQKTGSGKSLEDMVLLFLERFHILPTPETDCPGPGRLHTRSEGTAFSVLWPEGS